jgi:hypothetical protein
MDILMGSPAQIVEQLRREAHLEHQVHMTADHLLGLMKDTKVSLNGAVDQARKLLDDTKDGAKHHDRFMSEVFEPAVQCARAMLDEARELVTLDDEAAS